MTATAANSRSKADEGKRLMYRDPIGKSGLVAPKAPQENAAPIHTPLTYEQVIDDMFGKNRGTSES